MADRFAVLCVAYDRGRCERGVDIEALRDGDGRVPCVAVRGVAGSVVCDEREPPAAAAPVPAGRLTIMLDRSLAGACGECGEPITSVIDGSEGRLIALPCRHLLTTRRSA